MLPLEDLLDIVTMRDDPADQPTAIQLIQAAKVNTLPNFMLFHSLGDIRHSLEDVNYPPTGLSGEGYLSMTSMDFIILSLVQTNKLSSWNEIRQTVNVTDERLLVKYKSSALYAAVAYCSQQQDGLTQIIPPVQAGVLPLEEELAARFPGYSDAQMTQLMHDYEDEGSILKDLALEDVFDRVKELAMQEAEQEDADMSILPA